MTTTHKRPSKTENPATDRNDRFPLKIPKTLHHTLKVHCAVKAIPINTMLTALIEESLKKGVHKHTAKKQADSDEPIVNFPLRLPAAVHHSLKVFCAGVSVSMNSTIVGLIQEALKK